MRTIFYDRGKLLRSAAACGVFAVLSVTSVVLMLFAPFALLAGGLLLFRAFGDREAMRFDGEGLRVTGLFGRKLHRWADVQDIGVQRMTQRFMFGLITRHTDSIILRVRGGLTGSRKVGVRASLFDLGGAGVPALVVDLEHARRMGGAARPIHDPVPAPSGDGFDPDAALARYMARRQAGSVAEPAPVPAAPARPSFGRKVA